MKIKKRSKSNLNYQELVNQKRETFRIKDSLKNFQQLAPEKKSVGKLYFQKEPQKDPKMVTANKSHDKIFLKMLS